MLLDCLLVGGAYELAPAQRSTFASFHCAPAEDPFLAE